MKTYALAENGICYSTVQFLTLEDARRAQAQFSRKEIQVAEIDYKTYKVLKIVN